MRKNPVIASAVVALSLAACMGLTACGGSTSTASSSSSSSDSSSSSASSQETTSEAKAAQDAEAALQSAAVTNDDVTGTWKLTGGTDAKGADLDFDLFNKFEMVNTLTISDDGRFAFDLYEEETPGSWSINDSKLTLQVDEGESIEVKMVDGNLHLSLNGEQLVFSKQ